MYSSILPSVLNRYGVKWVSLGEPQKGYRNESYKVVLHDGMIVNLFFYKTEADILQKITMADRAAKILHDHGLPVRVRHDSRLLQVKANTYAALYEYLPGETISWEAYTMKHIKLLGWAMGDAHNIWKANGSSESVITDELRRLLANMQRYFADRNVRSAAHAKLGISINDRKLFDYEKVFQYCERLPENHLLHMDMVRGNVLFGAASQTNPWYIGDITLSGIIDFEKASYGHPVFDVARTLAFLIVDCPKPPAKVIHYFLEAGYNKRSASNMSEYKPLQPLITFFLMYDLYKFMRHTPYESLNENHHYIKTRDMLVKYGMISIYNK